MFINLQCPGKAVRFISFPKPSAKVLFPFWANTNIILQSKSYQFTWWISCYPVDSGRPLRLSLWAGQASAGTLSGKSLFIPHRTKGSVITGALKQELPVRWNGLGSDSLLLFVFWLVTLPAFVSGLRVIKRLKKFFKNVCLPGCYYNYYNYNNYSCSRCISSKPYRSFPL